MADQTDEERRKNLQEFLAMLGADPRAIGLQQALTTNDYINPLDANKEIGGTPSFYQGSKLGAYIYPPGPVQQSHPFMGALAGMTANRRNQAERDRIAEVIAQMGNHPSVPAPAATPTLGAFGRSDAPWQQNDPGGFQKSFREMLTQMGVGG